MDFEVVKIGEGSELCACSRCLMSGAKNILQEDVTGDIIEACPFCGHEYA